MARWKEKALCLQAELAGQKEAWRGERARLLAEKDEERRQAVASVRSECQADYQRFMEESKATLDSALDSARKRHHQELVSFHWSWDPDMTMCSLRDVKTQELIDSLAFFHVLTVHML